MNQNEIAKHLEEILDVLTDFIISIDKQNEKSDEIYITTYFLTILDYGRAIKNAVSSSDFISIPPLFRCQFEASIDLINLCKHENYEKVLYAIYLSHKSKMLHATFENSNNPFFKDTIKNFQNRGEEIKSLKKKLHQIKSQITTFKGDYTKIKNRFRYAGLEDLYTSVYALLCQDTHNDLLSVESRYLSKQNGKLRISANSNWTIHDVSQHLLTVLSVFEVSIIEICKRLDQNKPQNILDIIEDKYRIFDSFFAA